MRYSVVVKVYFRSKRCDTFVLFRLLHTCQHLMHHSFEILWLFLLNEFFGHHRLLEVLLDTSEYFVRMPYHCVDPDRKVRNYIFPKNETVWTEVLTACNNEFMISCTVTKRAETLTSWDYCFYSIVFSCHIRPIVISLASKIVKYPGISAWIFCAR